MVNFLIQMVIQGGSLQTFSRRKFKCQTLQKNMSERKPVGLEMLNLIFKPYFFKLSNKNYINLGIILKNLKLKQKFELTA